MLVGHLQSFRQVVCGPKDSKWHSLTTSVNYHSNNYTIVLNASMDIGTDHQSYSDVD
jgi:hypothetical protein